MVGIIMYNLKMSKTDVNKLLWEISDDNITYGLILKLQYIYGRNVGDILALKKEDIDISDNTIEFKLSKSNLILPIVPEICDVLINHVNGLPENEEYLFLTEDVNYNSNVLAKRINYYLNTKIDELNKGVNHKLSKITNRDLKMLRGQHLYLDNVPLEIIHELYNNFNYSETRRLIDYDGLKKSYGYDNVDNLLVNFTDLNLFRDDDYDKESIYVVMDMNNDYGVVEFVDGDLIVHEQSNITDRLEKFDIGEIYDAIKFLGDGEYKFVHGIKFLK
jgi:hypothetical protein